MASESKQLSNFLRRLLDARGLTKHDLIDDTPHRANTVSQLVLKGRYGSLKIDELARVLAVLGCDLYISIHPRHLAGSITFKGSHHEALD